VKKLILPLLLLLLLPGCLNYIQDINLYADGSGKMRITFWTKLPDNESVKILDKIGIFNPDSLRSEFSSKFTHIDSLNKMRAFSAANFSLKDGAEGLKIYSQFIPPIVTGFGINGNAYHVTYKYTFGGDILSDNSTSHDGRVLVWKYSLADIGSGKTISVTFRPFRLKETPPWIYVLSGLVLLIVIIFLFKKKKD